MKFRKMANHHGATSFLNSLLLEWNSFEKRESELSLDVGLDKKLLIPIKKFSLTGKHQYEGSFYLKGADGIDQLTFEEVLSIITQKLAMEFSVSHKETSDFNLRVKNSLHNTYTFLKKRTYQFQELFAAPVTFQSAEQALFAGHSFHPAPKSRDQFTPQDIENYSPEMGSQFPLIWIFLHSDLLFQNASKNFQDLDWMRAIFSEESSEQVPDHFIPFPIHPWQLTYIEAHPDVVSYLQDGLILKAKPSSRNWLPTSSLRTLYTKESSYMLKFSLSLKLTNSIRHMKVEELERGLKVHEVFSTPEGQKFVNENPDFEVIHEPVYAAIKNKDSTPIVESMIMGRINPFQDERSAIVLATLTQDHPQFEENLVQTFIQKAAKGKDLEKVTFEWVDKFLKVAIRPLLKAQGDYGILLGAHQQNMIIEIKDNYPVKSYFRDCHGTAYSESVQHLFGDKGIILGTETTSWLFGYYLIINSVFNLLAAASSSTVPEEILLKRFRQFLMDLKNEKPKDESFLDYLLNSETLMHKGNFLCSLRNINESTETNPLSIYTKIKNPLSVNNL